MAPSRCLLWEGFSFCFLILTRFNVPAFPLRKGGLIICELDLPYREGGGEGEAGL